MVTFSGWMNILLIIFLGIRYPGEWEHLFPLLGISLIIFRLNQDDVAAVITLLLIILLGGLTLLLSPLSQILVFVLEIILLLVVNYIFFHLSQKNALFLAQQCQMQENQEIRLNSLERSVAELGEQISRLQLRQKYYSGLENFWHRLNCCLQMEELRKTVSREIVNIIPADKAVYYDSQEAPEWFGYYQKNSEPVIIPDCQQDRRITVAAGVHSALLVPLSGGVENSVKSGYLLLVSRRLNNFDSQDQRLADILGKSISLAVQNIFLLEKTEQLAITDSLTGLYNRRYFGERLEEEINRAKFYSNQLSLAMIDIDHFKKVNDTYGHTTGDGCLVQLSNIFRQRLRETDFLARYGGEEFVIVFPRTGAEDSFRVLENIRQNVEKERFYLSGENRYFHLTISAGIVCLKHCPEADSTRLIQFADKALYQAKSAGRNKVIVYAQTT